LDAEVFDGKQKFEHYDDDQYHTRHFVQKLRQTDTATFMKIVLQWSKVLYTNMAAA
jgi:hypothetical protein